MKNCDDALSGTDVRAIAKVPASFLRPLEDSFLIGSFRPHAFLHVGREAATLDHESRITRWKIVLLVPGIHVREKVLDRAPEPVASSST